MENSYKCHFCKTCNGKGCIGQLPGMGGSFNSQNFILNCEFWEELQYSIPELALNNGYGKEITRKNLAIGPMTGAEQNMGWPEEESYYSKMMDAVWNNGIGLTIGDGEPDYKLLYGIQAVKTLQQKDPNAKASVFIKPYPNNRILERMEWAKDISCGLGIDIDSYNIITMRQKVSLERKNQSQIKELKDKASHFGVPFIIKGVFTKPDLELVAETHPDVVYISNHGGRVETEIGSSGKFLLENCDFLKKHCNEIWIDGGIRTASHIRSAFALGASKVLVGRPFITALCNNGDKGIQELSKTLTGRL